MQIQVAIDPLFRCYILSEALPPPHWADLEIDGVPFLSAKLAIFLYPSKGLEIMASMNKVAKDNGYIAIRPSGAADVDGGKREEGQGDSEDGPCLGDPKERLRALHKEGETVEVSCSRMSLKCANLFGMQVGRPPEN